MGVAVASGAVLRTLDKEHGPPRETRTSYGILQKLQYGHPEASEAHEDLPRKFIKYDRVDNEDYVEGIRWVIKQVRITI
jgi:hypothetical protein